MKIPCKPKKAETYWETLVKKYVERNYELEERECELRHRLEVMECTTPAILLFNMWKIMQNNPNLDVKELVMDKLKGVGKKFKSPRCLCNAEDTETPCGMNKPKCECDNAMKDQMDSEEDAYEPKCNCDNATNNARPRNSSRSSQRYSDSPSHGRRSSSKNAQRYSAGGEVKCECDNARDDSKNYKASKIPQRCECENAKKNRTVSQSSQRLTPCGESPPKYDYNNAKPQSRNSKRYAPGGEGSPKCECDNAMTDIRHKIKSLESERDHLICQKVDVEKQVEDLEEELGALRNTIKDQDIDDDPLSLESIKSSDIEIIKELETLTQKERTMKKRITELKHRELAYMETLQQAETWAQQNKKRNSSEVEPETQPCGMPGRRK